MLRWRSAINMASNTHRARDSFGVSYEDPDDTYDNSSYGAANQHHHQPMTRGSEHPRNDPRPPSGRRPSYSYSGGQPHGHMPGPPSYSPQGASYANPGPYYDPNAPPTCQQCHQALLRTSQSSGSVPQGYSQNQSSISGGFFCPNCDTYPTPPATSPYSPPQHGSSSGGYSSSQPVYGQQSQGYGSNGNQGLLYPHPTSGGNYAMPVPPYGRCSHNIVYLGR